MMVGRRRRFGVVHERSRRKGMLTRRMFLAAAPVAARAARAPGYVIQLDTIRKGFDGKTCWVHSRAGAIPGRTPSVVLTMQKLLLSGSDVFYPLNEMRTDDLGKTWSGPVEHGETLGRRNEEGGIEAVICDFTPGWHAKTGKLLGTGHVARYVGNKIMRSPRPRETAWSVYDAKGRQWTRWRTLAMPGGKKFFSAGAGCTQRVDLENGEILLPVYFSDGTELSATTVVRCGFDGDRLRYLENGDELRTTIPRGYGEPSLTKFQGRYYLTIRNDQRGYVTSGKDGLHFDEPRAWLWDDGSDLGNYNTQQHWITHGDGLFLVYTRRGAGNDHVFRHRAPLFMAQVDPGKLRVIRSTERVLVPQRGARLGNFGVVDVSAGETWVTVAEWMQPVGCEKYGSDNSVYAARIRWGG
jgi:hypothetical protein